MPFLKWAGVEGLRPDDLVPNEYQDKVYASLAVRLAREAAAWVKSRPEATDEQVDLAVSFAKIAQSDAKDTDKTWLEWSLASLLRRTGDRRGAAELIVRVLKKKRTEFWAWAEAARIHRDEQPDLAIACFCQALRLGAEPKFLGKVHWELAELLAEVGEVAQATRETLAAVATYDQEGWRHPPELEALLQAEWYDPALPSAEPREFYTLHADEALTLCFDEVREHQATYLGMTEAREGKKPRPRFSMSWNDRFVSILGRRNARLLKTLPPGSPVKLLLGIEGNRQDVLEVLARSDGSEWDCTEIKEGVVAGLHANGEGIFVYCSREEEYRFPAKSWIGTMSPVPGTGARAWGASNPLNGHFEAGRIEAAPLRESSDIRVFTGRLTRTTKGFGFVDEVFVSPPLVESAPPAARDVAVVAIMAFDKSKARHSWRAVAISACQ